MNRNTVQKRIILDAMQHRYDHPSVQMLYEDLKLAYPTMGIATVYRNLSSLVENGLLTSIMTKDNVTHYDYNRDDHCHLVCTKCNAIIDVTNEEVFANHAIIDDYKFTLMKQDVILYGICQKCK